VVSRRCARARGFTLAELLVAMSVLLLIGMLMLALMRSALETWDLAERQRRVQTRARAIFDCLAEDLESALTRDPPGSPPWSRMFCEPSPQDRPVLMLVRSWGSGPERAYTFHAGNALGGSAQVVYLHEGRTLKRAIRSPIGGTFAEMFPAAEPLAEDVLHFEVLLATPYTTTWDPRVPKLPSRKYDGRRGFGPERIWDSTRGLNPKFSFYAGAASRDDAEDDVFPERVRVTVVIEPHPLRTLRTDTLEPVDDVTARIRVASTRGFPPPGTDSSYILVDEEWVHYKDMDERSFTADVRGARNSVRAVHAQGAPVRCGTTFTRTFYLPGYRSERPGRAEGPAPDVSQTAVEPVTASTLREPAWASAAAGPEPSRR